MSSLELEAFTTTMSVVLLLELSLRKGSSIFRFFASLRVGIMMEIVNFVTYEYESNNKCALCFLLSSRL